MKSTMKILLMIAALAIMSNYVLGVRLKLKEYEFRSLEDNWERLFKDRTRSKLESCKEKPNVEITPQEAAMEKQESNASGISWNIPRKKPNYYAKKMIGWGPSAYLFDYLDYWLETKVVGEFKSIWDDVKKLTIDKTYQDPYTLSSMTGMTGEDSAMLARIKSLMTNAKGETTFNEEVWKESLTAGQIDAVIREWNWFANKSVPDPAKYIVDKFDFNGDGRLSPKEFIIAMIRTNKVVAAQGLCTHCMEEIIQDYIDPIFMYLDCQNEEKINAESIYSTITKLKRKLPIPDEKLDKSAPPADEKPEDKAKRIEEEKKKQAEQKKKMEEEKNIYDFTKCNYNGGGYRTAVCNDFVIKAQKTMDGYINKSEFRLAILQGYWARHVDDLSIHTDCTINMKIKRWATDGKVDIICTNLMNGTS